MKRWQSFNVNETVRVKLTDIGRRELQRQHDELAKIAPSLLEMPAYREDADGWVTFPMWDLMKCLGHLCGLGQPCPFETEIELQMTAETVGDVKP